MSKPRIVSGPGVLRAAASTAVSTAASTAASMVTEASCTVSVASRWLRGFGSEPDFGSSGLRSLPRGGGAYGADGAPVMLVHGLGANKSSFAKPELKLQQAGLAAYSVNYNWFDADVAACGAQLALEAARLRRESGAARAHVVAHSLGGVVLRWAVANTWMRDWVDVAVTLGSPHRGTPTARLAPTSIPGFGRLIGQLRPGGDLHDQLGHPADSRIRWVAVGSRHDWVVPADYALLPEASNVRNVVLSGVGHLSLPTDGRCQRIVVDELTRGAERDLPLAA